MAKVSNEKKLEALKSWLTENNIEFKENHKTKSGLTIDLWIQKLFIAVHVDNEESADFYKKTCRWCKPFFIRESETQAFILEKMQKCAFDQMMLMQKKWQKEQNKKG